MDPIAKIAIKKDTSFALLLEAQSRGYDIFYMESRDIWLQDGLCWGRMCPLNVEDHASTWYRLGDAITQPLVDLDLFLMRKDPPFDMQYVYLTYLLEQAEASGLRVINKPSSLRDANEKLYTAWFPQCCPKTLVSCWIDWLRDFIVAEEKVVVKPLGAMGGESIFIVHADDLNLNVILETMTQHQTQFVMAQRYIPEIHKGGDKRVLLLNGKPVQYALVRIPSGCDFRGNIACGAQTEGCELTDRDLWICEQVGPSLVDKGLVLVGLDIIGDYLTEINVTSPTGIRELDALYGMNIASDFFDAMTL